MTRRTHSAPHPALIDQYILSACNAHQSLNKNKTAYKRKNVFNQEGNVNKSEPLVQALQDSHLSLEMS
jgi:hypothetical protein